MKKLKDILNQYSSGKNVLLLFILTNIVYAIMLLVTIPKVMAFSEGIKLLDMMPMGYDLQYIQNLFEYLGNEGRLNYLVIQLRVDMIYPMLFAISYSLLMVYLLKRLNKLHSSFWYICLLPLVAGIADYMENFGIIALIKSYPDLSIVTTKVTSVFSIVKSMSTTLFFVALIIVFIMWGIKSIKKR